MLYRRQKALIGIFLLTGRILSRTELTKWTFLLRKETSISKDESFYDFVPYKFGPFSFTLFRELDELSRMGYIDSREFRLNPGSIDAASEAYVSLPPGYRDAIKGIVDNYGRLPLRIVLDYIYETYPWYASRSELSHARDNDPPVNGPVNEVFTAGYEGESIESFFAKLLKSNVRTLIDVRNNPISRKYGFSRNALDRLCQHLRIAYHHFPELGIPSSLRRGLVGDDDHEHLWKMYEDLILPNARDATRRMIAIATKSVSVLVCFEKDERHCHRHRLASALAHGVGLRVRHL